MKRILAALAVTGLAIMSAPATAIASPTESPGGGEMITICHATGSTTNPFVVITISLNGLNGHANANHQLSEDIIPANSGNVAPDGQNWTAGGQATFNNGCVPKTVPPAVPPAVVPPVVPPAVVPPAVVPGAVVPSGAGAAAGAGAVVAANPGFNVQTAVTGSPDVVPDVVPDLVVAPWAGALAVMLLAAAGVAARKSQLASGPISRRRKG
jgi:hypothetical protein